MKNFLIFVKNIYILLNTYDSHFHKQSRTLIVFSLSYFGKIMLSLLIVQSSVNLYYFFIFHHIHICLVQRFIQ